MIWINNFMVMSTNQSTESNNLADYNPTLSRKRGKTVFRWQKVFLWLFFSWFDLG